MKSSWWSEGVRFQCQGSGKCCLSRGEVGYVYLTLEDRKRLAEHLKIPVQQFTRQYCQKTYGIYHLTEDPQRPECMFLKDKRCSVYEARPTQCRTWPFWPEVMNARSWKKEVADFCPGVGKGPVIPAEKIEKALQEQLLSEAELGS